MRYRRNYKANTPKATAAAPKSAPALPVTCGIPPVLTADEPWDEAADEAEPADEVLLASSDAVDFPEAVAVAVAAVVAVALAVAGAPAEPAVIVTAIRGRSLEKVEALTPGKLAALPLAVWVHTAVVVPPTEQLTVIWLYSLATCFAKVNGRLTNPQTGPGHPSCTRWSWGQRQGSCRGPCRSRKHLCLGDN